MRQTAVEHPEARAYLERLERAARGLPRRERRELVEEIRGHLAAALAEADTEAEVRNAIDALGDPEDVVGAVDAPAKGRTGTLEIIAVMLLLFGAVVVPFVGWFAGMVLLWASATWTFREKLLGTLVVPGGLVTPFLFATLGVAGDCYAEGGSLVEVGGDGSAAPVEVPAQIMADCAYGVVLPVWVGIPLLVAMVVGAIAVPIVLLRRAQRRAVV